MSPVLELRDDVRDRLVLGVEVEQDADVPELERPVHEAGPLAELGRRGDREVDGERRAPDAALGAEHRDDAAGLAVLALDLGSDRDGAGAAARPTGRAGRDPGQLLLLAGVDLPDRRGELVRGERLDEELARPGQHRPAEVVGLALDGHHHDRGGRHLGGQAFRRRDAVHVRHVDVHQDDVRRELRRHLDGFAPGCRRSHDLDVRLEAQELREVIAGLRDVVDDQDADLVCHGSQIQVAGMSDGSDGDGPAVNRPIGSQERVADPRWRRALRSELRVRGRLDDLDHLRRAGLRSRRPACEG